MLPAVNGRSSCADTLDEALRATHMDLSDVDWRFRCFAAGSETCLRRSSYAWLDEPNPLLIYRLQSWPTFIGGEKIRELAEASRAINRLIRLIPERLFEGDAARLSEFYRMPGPGLAEALFRSPNGISSSLTRGDFLDTADGMKCIEFNFSPSLGGWESTLLSRLHLSHSPTADFIRDEGLEVSHTSTLGVLFAHVLAEVRAACIGSEEEAFDVVCVRERDDQAMQMPELHDYLASEWADFCREADIEGEIAVRHGGELEVRGGALYREGRRVRAAIDFSNDETGDLFRCFRAGSLCLFNTPASRPLTNKVSLALLSRYADSGAFDDEERRRIHAHVPWTRQAAADFATWRGERRYLPDLLVAERERMVLKEWSGFGGKSVVLGKTLEPERWSSWVERALAEGTWIAQELVESRPYLYQCGEQGCAPHDVVWGPFVFGNRYAGVILRMQPKAEGTAVNLSLEATEGLAFEV